MFFIFRDKKEQSILRYLSTDRIRLHLIRAVGGISVLYLFLFALRSISVAQTTLFTNTTPLFVPLIAYIWNRSKIGLNVWGGLAVAFAGMFFFLHPSIGSNNTGTWLALSSGLVGAMTLVTVRISHSTEPTFRTVFYYNCFSLIFSGIFCLLENTPFTMSMPVLAALSTVATFGFFSQLFYTLSVKYAPAKLVASFSYVAVIFSFIFDFFLGKIEILFFEIFGTILILSGISLVTIFLHKGKEKAPSPTVSEIQPELVVKK